ncbi:MAG: D-alanine--D-alanine ligase [Verrucomicrobia bacterium]|nr:D-alanine--D-alanine ligase [Verrucomicrobiota bacterium]
MSKKIKIGILFGGKSVEHEVSLQSARNVIESLDREKYSLTLIGIDKKGQWDYYHEQDYLINPSDPEAIQLGPKKGPVDLFELPRTLDIVFPVMHGYLGEDGAVQGLMKVLDLPCVGADVLGSAIGMDKDVMKRLLREAGVPVANFLTLHKHERHLWPRERIIDHIPLPLFVKPSNGGSSIGICKVKEIWELEPAISAAFQYDRKVLIEEAINGHEIQFSMIGNENPSISLPCKIVPKGDFHSYACKYIDKQGSEFIIPVQLDPDTLISLQRIALKTYRTLCCEGMARVDLFLKQNGDIILNELNTIPGLTSMSPYSKMWQVSGVSYCDFLNRVIEYAFDRYAKENELVREISLKEQWIKQ